MSVGFLWFDLKTMIGAESEGYGNGGEYCGKFNQNL